MIPSIRTAAALTLLLLLVLRAAPYPIDAYQRTGIRRLERQRLIASGEIKGTPPPPGALRGWQDIRLQLTDPGALQPDLTTTDPELTRKIAGLFAGMDPAYGAAVLDITPGSPARLALWKSDDRYMPGSVGKLAVVAGLFNELQRIYPYDEDARLELLKTRMVQGDFWVRPNSHTVPVFDPETRAFQSRTIRETDVFSLFEWADHMISASSNAAASVVWKEVMLLKHFGSEYPPSPDVEKAFFRDTPKTELRDLAVSVVNDPLRSAGIPEEAWRLGSLFTSAGKQAVPGTSSYGTARALLTYLVRLEQGRVVDRWSSLEIKRLMYQTQRRIRYAASPALADDAVFFKSGSQYKCQPEPDFTCVQYQGNVDNYMNSVATVEASDGRIYIVTIMSNVLRKNSASDHLALASSIDRLIRN